MYYNIEIGEALCVHSPFHQPSLEWFDELLDFEAFAKRREKTPFFGEAATAARDLTYLCSLSLPHI